MNWLTVCEEEFLRKRKQRRMLYMNDQKKKEKRGSEEVRKEESQSGNGKGQSAREDGAAGSWRGSGGEVAGRQSPPGRPRPEPPPACLPVPGPGGGLASTGGGGRAAVGLFVSESLLSPSADCRSVQMIQNSIYIYIFLLDLNLWAKTCGHSDNDLPLNVILSVIAGMADTKLTHRFTGRVEAGVGGTS